MSLFANFSTRQTRIAMFLAVWLLSVSYLGANLNHGWLSYDDGALGQSAERVLHGEIPHLDFADPYTGGLAFLDALVFKIFGVQLIWLRLPLFVFFVLWVPAVYAIARQFLSPLASAGVTLVSVAWSVPNYPAAMPSWYNLYFATFGVLAVAKYIRKPALHWLVLAGLAGGCSFLFKSVGLYFIAAVLLFFVYREQSLSRAPGGPTRRSLAYLAFLTLSLSLLVVALLKLVFTVAEAADFVHFVFPGAAIAALLIARERIPARPPSLARFSLLLRMAVPFLLSAALPVALFLLFYWRHHAVAAWFHGVFVAPQLRLSYARLTLASLIFEYVPLIVVLFFIETASLRGHPRRFLSIFLIVVAALVLLTVPRFDLSYILALESAVGIIPILVVLAAFVLLREPGSALDNQLLFLLLTTVAICSLIQFPFSQTMYFCYISALVVFLAAALISRLPNPPRAITAAAVAFNVLFAVFVLRTGHVGPRFQFDYASTPIGQLRAGPLYVSKMDADQYQTLIPFVKELAHGKPILAGPDAPEVYFLADLKNPTSLLFDSVEDPMAYERQIRSLLLEPSDLKVVVIKEKWDPPTVPLLILRQQVSSSFPHSRKIGFFTVYWRP
jgi:Dolichyl-phosphate-mannose-protein mannosyltransferase